MLRTITVPILSSFKRIVPTCARARSLPSNDTRRSVSISTYAAADNKPQTERPPQPPLLSNCPADGESDKRLLGERKSLTQHEPKIPTPSRLTGLSTPLEFTKNNLRGPSRDGTKIEDFETESVFCLPPDMTSFQSATPGSYRLRSSGRVVENPDYLANWTCISQGKDKTGA